MLASQKLPYLPRSYSISLEADTVMALIGYLVEFKRNYGPHLIIVPDAVLVNWKNEQRRWFPSLSYIFYAGGKDQRTKILSSNCSATNFNVLVTTYEFIMSDCAKLSK
ncbi:hypothetical protein LguiA_034512 [Lonicera macranthoides]